MKSLNRVTLLGYLAADVELHQTKKKNVIATFSVVTNRNSIGEDGKKFEVADFHRLTAFGHLGEICNKYIRKGSLVLAEGKLKNRSFDDKDGVKQYRTEIVLDYLNILSPPKVS